MNKDTALWARTVGSIGAGVLGLALVALPIYNILRGNPLDNDPSVKTYLCAERDQKEIKRLLTKAEDENLWLMEPPRVETNNPLKTAQSKAAVSNYERLNSETYSKFNALKNIRDAQEYFISDLRYNNPKIQEWDAYNIDIKLQTIGFLPLSALCLFSSYALFPRKREEDKKKKK